MILWLASHSAYCFSLHNGFWSLIWVEAHCLEELVAISSCVVSTQGFIVKHSLWGWVETETAGRWHATMLHLTSSDNSPCSSGLFQNILSSGFFFLNQYYTLNTIMMSFMHLQRQPRSLCSFCFAKYVWLFVIMFLPHQCYETFVRYSHQDRTSSNDNNTHSLSKIIFKL